jgi:hypothetical protein
MKALCSSARLVGAALGNEGQDPQRLAFFGEASARVVARMVGELDDGCARVAARKRGPRDFKKRALGGKLSVATADAEGWISRSRASGLLDCGLGCRGIYPYLGHVRDRS